MKLISILLILIVNSILSSGSDIFETKLFNRQKKSLLFPRYTTLQTSMCLIAQISSLPSHRVALNIGFQTNYNLPYELPSFYSPIFWARKFSKTSNPLVNFFERITESEYDFAEINENVTTNYSKGPERNSFEDTIVVHETQKPIEKISNGTIETHDRTKRMLTFDSDITAGKFYNEITDILEYVGYHEDCLLKTVCELARYPLIFEENHENIIYEILHLLLTPSAHNSFDPEKEVIDKKLFEEAERLGNEGTDCEIFYNECKVSPLHSISNFILLEN